MHLRALSSGAEIGPAGGTLVADAAVTEPASSLSTAFASTSTDALPGTLLVIHDDGGAVEIARFDEVTGQRLGSDAVVPGSLRCSATGAPLVTPPAADGTRLLFFTVTGACPMGQGLVRYPVGADGTLGEPAVGRVDGLAPADPVLVVVGQKFQVAVGRAGGLELFAADGTLAAAATDVALDVAEVPAAIANDSGTLLALTSSPLQTRLRRVTLTGTPRVAATARLDGQPVGLAVGAQRIVAATDTALTVLRRDFSVGETVPGGGSVPAVAGEFAFQVGRAVRLDDGAQTVLPSGGAVAPAIARGFVTFGPFAFLTADLTPPMLQPARGLAAQAADDRGVGTVRLLVGGLRLTGHPAGSPWAPSRYTASVPAELAPGAYVVRLRAVDLAGNVSTARGRVRVDCDHSLRGSRRAESLRGGVGRDCVTAHAGDDVVVVTGGGGDRVACGLGRDTVRADRHDRVASDCERVRRLREG